MMVLYNSIVPIPEEWNGELSGDQKMVERFHPYSGSYSSLGPIPFWYFWGLSWKSKSHVTENTKGLV